MRLTHVRLLVDDFDTCFAFYRDVVGLEPTLEAGGVYAEFRAGEAILALYQRALMAEVVGSDVTGRRPGAGDDVVVSLAVEDVDAAARELEGRGARLVTQPHDQQRWVIRVAHLRDPENHLLELYQPLT